MAEVVAGWAVERSPMVAGSAAEGPPMVAEWSVVVAEWPPVVAARAPEPYPTIPESIAKIRTNSFRYSSRRRFNTKSDSI